MSVFDFVVGDIEALLKGGVIQVSQSVQTIEYQRYVKAYTITYSYFINTSTSHQF